MKCVEDERSGRVRDERATCGRGHPHGLLSIPERHNGAYLTRAARLEDSPGLIDLIASNPIHMDAEYVVDRSPDFFALHRCFPGSGAIVSERKGAGMLAACASLLRYHGRLGAAVRPYLYVTDICRRPGVAPHPVHHTALAIVRAHLTGDAPALVCLINEGNDAALRMVDGPRSPLRFHQLGRLDYVEALPLLRHRVPRRYTVRRAATREDLERGLGFLSAFHARHALWEPLTAGEIERRAEFLPGFGTRNLVLMEEAGVLVGALLYCDPTPHVNVRVVRYDRWARLAGAALRQLARLTGRLNAPPAEGEVLRTLQVQALAWQGRAGHHLLGWLGNEALAVGAHSVSHLSDERHPLPAPQRLRFTYKTRAYAAFKRDAPCDPAAIAGCPLYFNITHG